MSAIKRFFEKKKIEMKFKTAGEGKKLTDNQVVKNTDKSKEEFFGSTSFTEEKLKAAEAAINRLNTKKDPKKGDMQNLQILSILEPSDSQINKLKVQFTCSLFENVSLPKNELEDKITEYLYSELPSEPEMVSLLILQTLNKNPEQIKNCAEMLEKYLNNIISHPDEEKYRKIKLSNKILQEKVIPLKGAEEFLHSVGFMCKEFEMDNIREQYLINEEKDIDKLIHAKELIQVAEPITLQLDRDCKIYQPSGQASKMPALSDDFFSISADELKKEQEIRKQAVEEAGMLMTKEMREKDKKRGLRRYKYVLLRCRLPDEYIIQATFSSRETLHMVRKYVSSCLADESTEFNFFSQVCGRITESDESKSLVELGLAPASLLEVVDIQKGGGGSFLNKDLVTKAQKL